MRDNGTMTEATTQGAGTMKCSQYYVFEGPSPEQEQAETWAWVEAFDDLGHWIAPTPFQSTARALAELDRRHPNAHIDSLYYEEEIAEAQAHARRGGLNF